MRLANSVRQSLLVTACQVFLLTQKNLEKLFLQCSAPENKCNYNFSRKNPERILKANLMKKDKNVNE